MSVRVITEALVKEMCGIVAAALSAATSKHCGTMERDGGTLERVRVSE